MHDHHHYLGPGALMLAELLSGSTVAHLLTTIPPWLGGGLTALLVGVVLRVADPALRRLGERLSGAPPR